MSEFYIAGGTLNPNARCYVEREADRLVFDHIVNGEFCYVLTSRQMGKSSLMAQASHQLTRKGIRTAMIDLTAIGQNVTAEQWYDGMLVQVGEQLDLEDELEAFWREHSRISPVQRFIRSITQVVLKCIPEPVTIFVDEIDVVLSLSFSADEFFAAIRELYNRRISDPELKRINFCLLGVASPTDLVTDNTFSPFSAGYPVPLRDFTLQETEQLALGLGDVSGQLHYVSHQVYYWTKGHPYLTLRLFLALSEENPLNGIEDVDRVCESVFLEPGALTADPNLNFVQSCFLRSQVPETRAELLDYHRAIYEGQPIVMDRHNPILNQLYLSGVVTQDKQVLQIRNDVYRQVFSLEWVQRHRSKSIPRKRIIASKKGKSLFPLARLSTLLVHPYTRAAVIVIAASVALWFLGPKVASIVTKSINNLSEPNPEASETKPETGSNQATVVEPNPPSVSPERTSPSFTQNTIPIGATDRLIEFGNFSIALAAIPAGAFEMGSLPTDPDSDVSEQPRRTITITTPFEMAKTEITLQQWNAVMDQKRDSFNRSGATLPVGGPRRFKVNDFCRKLTELAQDQGLISPTNHFRLPTEAEWEYCCRAGTTTAFSFGTLQDSPPKHAWFQENSNHLPQAVAQKLPNAWGLFDMHGNLSEWTADRYSSRYDSQSLVDPKGPENGTSYVYRGGDFTQEKSELRAARRSNRTESTERIGFRVALAVDQTAVQLRDASSLLLERGVAVSAFIFSEDHHRLMRGKDSLPKGRFFPHAIVIESRSDLSPTELEQASKVIKPSSITVRDCQEFGDTHLRAISNLSSLKILILERCVIGDEAAKDLALPNLKTLRYDVPTLSERFLNTIIQRLPKLSELSITAANLSHQSLAQLNQLRQLQELNLSKIRDLGTLLPSLAKLKNLKALTISHSHGKPSAWEHFGEFPALTELQLANCNPTAATIQQFASTPLASSLVLEGDHISDSTVANINPTDTKIEMLSIARSSLTSEGLKSITNLSTLQELRLLHNDDISQNDLQLLETMDRLKILTVIPNNEALLRRLREALPQCEVRR